MQIASSLLSLLTYAGDFLELIAAYVEDEIRIKRSKAHAHAALYKADRLAEADQLVLTDEYIRLLAIEGFATNATIVFGDDIPDMLPFGGVAGSS